VLFTPGLRIPYFRRLLSSGLSEGLKEVEQEVLPNGASSVLPLHIIMVPKTSGLIWPKVAIAELILNTSSKPIGLLVIPSSAVPQSALPSNPHPPHRPYRALVRPQVHASALSEAGRCDVRLYVPPERNPAEMSAAP
jgi:hypothetical protein